MWLYIKYEIWIKYLNMMQHKYDMMQEFDSSKKNL